MKNYCENQYCIYYENNECILDAISLDEIGVCRDGIQIDIEEEHLAKQRKKLLKLFEQQDSY